jgi:hypothetical protein
MKTITQYINEGMVDMLIKFFVGKLKMLQKKFNISENSIEELSNTLAENQDNLNNELSNLAKGKIKDSDGWWKGVNKVKPETAKVISPEKVNNQLFTNILNISGVYQKAIKEWEQVGILDTPQVMLHIQRDVKDLLVIFETISKDNGKQANISTQLDKLHNILSNITLKNNDAKEILDDVLNDLDGKGSEFVQKYSK